jgi:cysteine desulfurase
MIYLDYNATAPMKPAVRAALLEAMERCGNPSSVHRFGRSARRHMDEARARVAALAGVKPAQVIFTSGGTEANATALRGIAASCMITSSIEHGSVLAEAPSAQRLPVDRRGVVDLDAAEKILQHAPRGALLSVMLVNNETGVVQPVAEIARLAKTYGHRLHSDAVQAAGRLPIDFAALGVDALTLSAHKIGGPQGVGALIVDEKLALQPLLKGGGQEMNRRAGTENVAGIVGFGVAAQLAVDDLRDAPRLAAWRDRLQQRLMAIAGEDATAIGANAPRVAGTLNIAMRGVGSETQVAAMDLAGIAVSAGAACSSGKVKASHVLRAMGYADDVAGAALRISLGWNTEESDIEHCIEAWQALYRRARMNAESRAA